MNRMQKHNLYNIKRNFEKKTGTRLISAGRKEEKVFAETEAPRKRLPRVARPPITAMVSFGLKSLISPIKI